MTNSEIWNLVLRAAEIFSVSYGTVFLNNYVNRRKELKKEQKFNDMDHGMVRIKQVGELLEETRFELECDRVIECGFSNGEVTFSGIHMKKLSILNETESSSPLAPHFQLVPVKMFKRNIECLYEAQDDVCVFREYQQDDDLASINKRFELMTMIAVKIRDERNRWIGILIASWKEEREITDDEIAYVKLQASRLASIN